jgi:hypothetical protein
VKKREVNDILTQLDSNGNGMIEYSEIVRHFQRFVDRSQKSEGKPVVYDKTQRKMSFLGKVCVRVFS